MGGAWKEIDEAIVIMIMEDDDDRHGLEVWEMMIGGDILVLGLDLHLDQGVHIQTTDEEGMIVNGGEKMIGLGIIVTGEMMTGMMNIISDDGIDRRRVSIMLVGVDQQGEMQEEVLIIGDSRRSIHETLSV